MNRSSSRKDLRTERIAGSPYARKERQLKRTESKSTLSSLFNFVSSSLKRTISRNNVDDDESVSGSEDEWNGEPPSTMQGQDVFSLAAAGGRSGSDFEERAQSWRKQSFAPSSRNGLASSKSTWGLLDLSEDRKIRPSPSMPAISNVQQTPLPSSSTSRLPALFATPGAQFSKSGEQSTPSYNALRAYLDGNGNDLQVIEGLARQIRSEKRQPQETGGWSAGIATPVRPSTPLRQAATYPGTPGSAFSLGAAPSAASSRKVTYLGPGMSPRRLPRSRTVVKPLFDTDELAGKKRKVNGWSEVVAGDLGSPAVATSSSVSSASPNQAAESAAAEFNMRSKISAGSSSQAHRPSPLGQASPVKADAVRAAKKRVNNVLEDIYDEVVGPSEPPARKIQVNPYEQIARPEKMGTKESLRRSTSAMKMSLRGSMRASRGAAQKLEQLKGSGRKLTTLELVSGYKGGSATPSAPTAMEVDGEETEEDEEVDELIEPTPIHTPKLAEPPAPVRSFPPAKIDEPEPFKPFKPTTLSQSTFGPSDSTLAPSPRPVQPEESATYKAIMESSKPTSSPAFSPRPVGLGPPPSVPKAAVPQPSTARSASRRRDPSAIYLSAKDSALSVDRAALPFFTFTMPSSGTPPTQQVKDAARANAIEMFSFTLRKPSLTSQYYSPPQQDAATFHTTVTPAVSEWTCDLCMLKNPDTAKEKCSICDAPRPKPQATNTTGFKFQAPTAKDGEWECGTCMLKNLATATDKCTICDAKKPTNVPMSASAAPAPTSSFSLPKSNGAPGEWECGTCMLKNPATATEKCTICDAAKPASASASSASVPTLSLSQPAAAAGEWECDTCMLKNPATATEKCTICDAPKPGAQTSAKPAAAPVAMPSVPTGGFSFLPSASSLGPPAPPSGGFTFLKPSTPSSSAPSSTGFTPAAAPPSGGFSFGAPAAGGFKPTAAPPSAGFSFGAPSAPKPMAKPTGGEGEWTCGLCMLKNPASATEKCTVCDAPKP